MQGRAMPTKIMIVDDSFTVRQQVASTLTEAGFQVVEAVDGEDAHARIGAEAELALVICDVNMPKMNGLELLEKVRAEPRFATLPVLMLTTEGQPELIAKAKSLGARGWMVKPFKPEQLVAAAKKLTTR